MTVLLVLHLMQVVIDGAYKAPREVNFWFGVVLLLLVLSLSLTGYLLPWDQKGYWATQGRDEHRRHHAGRRPVPCSRSSSAAGLRPRHAHAFFCPARGRDSRGDRRLHRRPHLPFPPPRAHAQAAEEEARRRVLAGPGVQRRGRVPRGPGGGAVSHRAHRIFSACTGRRTRRARGSVRAFSAARPEWYFLFLFQFLKYFPRQHRDLGGADHSRPRHGRHFSDAVLAGTPAIGASLQYRFCPLSSRRGRRSAHLSGNGRGQHNQTYLAAVKSSGSRCDRVNELATSPAGIPTGGAVTLLRNDPLTQGPKLFARNAPVAIAMMGTMALATSRTLSPRPT